MSHSKTSIYLNAIGCFARYWISNIFPTEYRMLEMQPEGVNSINLSSKYLYSDEVQLAKLKENRDTDIFLAACFSLLFTRYISTTINEDVKYNSINRPILTFVSKKGYWLYRVARNGLCFIKDVFSSSTYEECTNFWSELVEVKSDRYFLKSPQINMYSNCNIILIDDISHTGESISEFTNTMWNDGRTIHCIVFAIHQDALILLSEKHIPIYSPNKDLDNDALGELSIRQVALFQALGVPYAIDLPIIKLENTHCHETHNIGASFSSGFISFDVFNRIRKECNEKGWKCVDTSFFIAPDEEVKSCVFCLNTDPLMPKYKNLFQNLVVECSYRHIGEYVDVSLVPFAIMRSINFYELFTLYNIVFKDTDYRDELFIFIKKYIPSKRFYQNKHNIYFFNILITALYRSLVYFFSLYVSKQFHELLSHYDIFLWIDNSHVSEHWDECFFNSNVIALFSDQSDISYKALNSIFEKIYAVNDIELSDEYWTSKKEIYPLASYENLYFIMHKFFSQPITHKKTNFCSIERLEATMSKISGKQIDDLSFRNEFTQTILRMLNQSAISNSIYFDRSSGFVLRGFRPGENCNLLLPFNQPTVFCALYEYYSCCINSSTEKNNAVSIYKKNYDQMTKMLLDYIYDARLNTYLDVNETKHLLDYYRNIDPEVHIKNKKYIVTNLNEKKSTDAILAKVLQSQVRTFPLQ